MISHPRFGAHWKDMSDEDRDDAIAWYWFERTGITVTEAEIAKFRRSPEAKKKPIYQIRDNIGRGKAIGTFGFQATCVVRGCTEPLKARHLCSAHYQKSRRMGLGLTARSTHG